MLKAWAGHDVETFGAFRSTVSRFEIDLSRAAVLDVGCGANAPMTLMLKAFGANVVGIDYHVGHRWGLGFRPSRYVQYAREAGVGKTARKLLGEIVYDRQYFATLRERSRLPITERGLDLREMDILDLQFPNESFDVVHSNATWEHVLDVGRANREITRILKPGGLAYIEIHLFPSLSGGHDLPWIVPGRVELGGVRPWRHLLDPTWQAPVPLNRLSTADYKRLFVGTAGLELLEWRTEYTEAEDLLNNAITAKLPQYSREDLTTRSTVAILRKTSH